MNLSQTIINLICKHSFKQIVMNKFLLLLFIIPNVILSQVDLQNWCGQTHAEQKLIKENPELQTLINDEKELVKEQLEKYKLLKSTGTVYYIPVVFHILHEGGPENISDAQVHDAMRILNEDFRKTNADISQVIPEFNNISGNTEIQFQLAQKDPDGNCTNGINHIYSELTNDGGEDSKINQWPRNKYLNVWVVKEIENGAAGYTFLPATVNFQPWRDGIIILHDYIGSVGTANAIGSRSLTHEVGHWLNLPHTWGQSNNTAEPANCNDDDGISDTPNCIGSNSCNLSSSTCGSLDNVQNYMDYSFCSVMFTQGQVDVMRAAATGSTAQRADLITASNHEATGINGVDNLCKVDFSSSAPLVCLNDTIILTDESYHNPNQWEWEVDNSTSNTYTNNSPTVVFDSEGYSDITLQATNASGSLSLTKNGLVRVISRQGEAIDYSEGFETENFPNISWTRYSRENDDNTNWEIVSSTAYSGSKCIKLNNVDNPEPGHQDILYSPLLDLSNALSTNIKFRVAYAQKDNSNFDKLKLYISKDCGQTWSLKTQRIGSSLASAIDQQGEFIPATLDDWKLISFNFSTSELTSSAMIKFEFTGDGGNNIYIDDINITGVFSPIPILNFPTDSSTTSINVTLDWKAVNEANEYIYQVDTTISFNSSGLIEGSSTALGNDHWNSDTELELTSLEYDTTYFWRIKSITDQDTSEWSETWSFKPVISTGVANINDSKNVLQIFPNPTKDIVNLTFEIKQPGLYTLDLFDVSGKKIKAIRSSTFTQTGIKNIQLMNRNLDSGVYYVILRGENINVSKKFILTK